jgi:peptidoglycan/xylan/chitin deacetylase (PgdA/CDA1 family)
MHLALFVACGDGSGDSTGRGSESAPPAASASLSTGPTPTPEPTTADPPAVPDDLRGKDVTEIPTGDRVVALTFDAGANSAGLPSILGTLADQQVPATFFLTGQWVDDNPQGVAVIHADGHRLGNHSMTHPHFPALPDQAIRDEVRGAEERILAAGADPRPLFRFPFGDRDERTIAAVNDLGYVAVRWTVDTLGWRGTSGGMSAQEVADRAVNALRPGEIVLMHIGSNPEDGTTLDADALPDTIERMRAAGYTFVTLDALLPTEDRRRLAAG